MSPVEGSKGSLAGLAGRCGGDRRGDGTGWAMEWRWLATRGVTPCPLRLNGTRKGMWVRLPVEEVAAWGTVLPGSDAGRPFVAYDEALAVLAGDGGGTWVTSFVARAPGDHLPDADAVARSCGEEWLDAEDARFDPSLDERVRAAITEAMAVAVDATGNEALLDTRTTFDLVDEGGPEVRPARIGGTAGAELALRVIAAAARAAGCTRQWVLRGGKHPRLASSWHAVPREVRVTIGDDMACATLRSVRRRTNRTERVPALAARLAAAGAPADLVAEMMREWGPGR